MKTWIKDWLVTLRYGSRFTKAGRALRASLRDADDPTQWAEVGPPGGYVPGPSYPFWRIETWECLIRLDRTCARTDSEHDPWNTPPGVPARFWTCKTLEEHR